MTLNLEDIGSLISAAAERVAGSSWLVQDEDGKTVAASGNAAAIPTYLSERLTLDSWQKGGGVVGVLTPLQKRLDGEKTHYIVRFVARRLFLVAALAAQGPAESFGTFERISREVSANLERLLFKLN